MLSEDEAPPYDREMGSPHSQFGFDDDFDAIHSCSVG